MSRLGLQSLQRFTRCMPVAFHRTHMHKYMERPLWPAFRNDIRFGARTLATSCPTRVQTRTETSRSAMPKLPTQTVEKSATSSMPSPPPGSPLTSSTSPRSPPAAGPPHVTLSEDILTIPNILTLTRMSLCPILGWAVATHQAPLTLALLGVAGCTDLLDGWIARRYQSQTVFGSIADPAADKMLMATMVISLAIGGGMHWALAAIILGRDVFLVALAFIMRYRSLSPPRTLARYFNPRLPSAHVTPTQLSKFNTFLQLVLVGVLTLFPLLPESVQTHPHTTRTVSVLEYVVAGTTLWTGVDYATSRRSVRFLHVK